MTPPTFDLQTRSAAETLIDLALAEDLGEAGDVTGRALIAPEERAEVAVVSREPGVLAGGPVLEMVFARLDPAVRCEMRIGDGEGLASGSLMAVLAGPLRALLAGERTALNFLAHLSGIATLTRRFVEAAAGTKAAIYDTRKTLPGYRALEKYAVRAGGGINHRMGLYDAVLIKDNHLAAWARPDGGRTVAAAVRRARDTSPAGMPVEVEVDSLDQLADALTGKPDIVLLDNMAPVTLAEAVRMRDRRSAGVVLEASGGVTLESIAGIARTGVDRISVGALTHSARALDIGFDWPAASG